MLVIKIELWPGGDQTKAEEIHRAYIANDGTGSDSRGNYKFFVFRKGSKSRVLRKGRIEGFPRKSKGTWDLLSRVFDKAFKTG